jgi:DNA polymerase III epsilon subunit family exonuclease
MAQAMFSGRSEFRRDDQGRWLLADITAEPYNAHRSPAPTVDLLSRLSYVVVDVETTGSSPYWGDRITEIAAVVVKDGEIAEVFETLVNPQRSIPPIVTRLTNITWDMVRNAPTFERVAQEVVRVLDGNIFVAHNADFDWRFVTAEVARATNFKLRGRRLCTVKLARQVLPQLSRRSLDYVARYYGVEITRRHRAGGDAVATARCLIRMMNDLTDRGCSTWQDLEQLLRRRSGKRRKRRPPALPTSVTKDTTA